MNFFGSKFQVNPNAVPSLDLRNVPSIVIIYPSEMVIDNNVDTESLKNIDNIDSLIGELLTNMDIENNRSKDIARIYRELVV